MDQTPKTYTMLKTVPGSRDGLKVETFAKGSTHTDLPPELVEQFFHQGAIEEGGSPAARRQTKVTGPTETKVTGPTETKEGEAGVPLGTQHIEELVSLARDTYGLDVDSTMDEATLRQMIEQAQAEADADAADTDLSKMTKRALVVHAEGLGLALDESMKKDELLAAIAAHAAA